MGKKPGHAARTCGRDMNMQHGHIYSMERQSRDEAWTCSTICSMGIHQGHAAWTLSMDPQHRHAAWTCRMDMHYGYEVQKFKTDKRYTVLLRSMIE